MQADQDEAACDAAPLPELQHQLLSESGCWPACADVRGQQPCFRKARPSKALLVRHRHTPPAGPHPMSKQGSDLKVGVQKPRR